jgi:hypothetical protein
MMERRIIDTIGKKQEKLVVSIRISPGNRNIGMRDNGPPNFPTNKNIPPTNNRMAPNKISIFPIAK